MDELLKQARERRASHCGFVDAPLGVVGKPRELEIVVTFGGEVKAFQWTNERLIESGGIDERLEEMSANAFRQEAGVAGVSTSVPEEEHLICAWNDATLPAIAEVVIFDVDAVTANLRTVPVWPLLDDGAPDRVRVKGWWNDELSLGVSILETEELFSGATRHPRRGVEPR